MKLLLEGLFATLVLMCELVGLVALAKPTETTTSETTPPPAQESFTTIVASDDGKSYQWVKWEGSYSVRDLQSSSEGDIAVEVNSPEAERASISGEAKHCRVVHIRPHLPNTRQPGAVGSSGGHRAESTSENTPSSRHFGE
jgi:hypothetical protein